MRPTARLNLIAFLLFICSLTFGQIKSTKENHAPVFVKEMPDTVIDFGKIFKFTYKAIDEDNDKLLFTSVNPLPPRATLNDTTGVFSWKPLAGQGGKYEIIINVTDGKATTQSRKTKLLMTPTQIYHNEIKLASSPSDGGTPGVSSIWCNEEDTITVKAKANNGYRFMNWKENDSVVSKDSVYTFVVTKNRNLVANFRENHAPVFVKEMPDTSILAERVILYGYKAIDPDGDIIKYSIYSKSELLMQVDSTSGVFACRAQRSQAGNTFSLIITANDGILTTLSKKTIITVYIIPSVESEILPTEYNLSQNYPNPFNPETTIEYTIPKDERVTLKVFDVLGREVATIVDEYKQAGNYKATFNVETLRATSLPSGVYFYRLQAGSYNETKKLCLIK